MFDFIKYRYFFLAFSFSLIFAIAGLFTYKLATTGKTFNYSIEFEGGTQFMLKFDVPVKSSDVISVFEKNGFSGITIREFPNNELVVRVKDYVKDLPQVSLKIIDGIKLQVPNSNARIISTDGIGAGIGKEMRSKSTKAVAISLILMLLYIAFRFWSFGFAFGAVAALAHDAIIILGFFLFFNMEISVNVIAAILTILGYSVNDTIVIFARIRDNIKSMSGAPIEEIVNVSLNQTLTRTLLTSFATLLTVLSLLIFGGEALRDMSYALIIGIIFGTYSSIYMASSIMMWFYKEKKTA